MSAPRKAVIPAAGLGTRFLPATKAVPKEMLPIVDVPTIQYIVEEVVQSGLTDVVLVTGRGKSVIEDHFDVSPELERFLEEKGKPDLLKMVRELAKMAHVVSVRQKQPLGLGQACEDGERALLHRRGQAAPGEQVADLRPGAVPVVVRGRPLVRALAVHARVELGRRDARARHALDRDLDTGERERRDRLAQRRERQAEVEQRAHRHVAADARERVQVGDPHHGPPR